MKMTTVEWLLYNLCAREPRRPEPPIRPDVVAAQNTPIRTGDDAARVLHAITAVDEQSKTLDLPASFSYKCNGIGTRLIQRVQEFLKGIDSPTKWTELFGALIEAECPFREVELALNGFVHLKDKDSMLAGLMYLVNHSNQGNTVQRFINDELHDSCFSSQSRLAVTPFDLAEKINPAITDMTEKLRLVSKYFPRWVYQTIHQDHDMKRLKTPELLSLSKTLEPPPLGTPFSHRKRYPWQ